MKSLINDKTDEVLKELFQSLLSRHQIGLETLMKCSDFVFDCIHLVYYKCHKINPNRGGSYINSPDWIKNKKTTTNPIDKNDNKCFQYAVTIVLNHEGIKKYPQRI